MRKGDEVIDCDFCFVSLIDTFCLCVFLFNGFCVLVGGCVCYCMALKAINQIVT